MPERNIGRKEQAEIDFWDGHHWRDNCAWRDHVRHLVLHESESQYRNSFDRIKQLITSGQGYPVKRLENGESFSFANFPLGSILRIEYDASYFGGDRHGEKVWGIVDQAREFMSRNDEQFDVLLGFVEDKLKASDAPILGRRSFIDSGSPATVGQVNHFRESGEFAFGLIKIRYPVPLLDILTGVDQSLFRYNSVEVWAAGLGVRRPVVNPKSLLERMRRVQPQGI